ncbi:MAG: hypothetical protein JRD93_16020 [Deltaproteobacteria bacterium]|nr:hypothetical protein [Deltaproteobacteria bacterium]
MNNTTAKEKIEQCLEELEKIKDIIIAIGRTSHPVPFLTKYAIVKSCGTIEICFKAILSDHELTQHNRVTVKVTFLKTGRENHKGCFFENPSHIRLAHWPFFIWPETIQ